MKYLLFLLALFATETAQGQCSEFDNLLKKGDSYLKGSKPNYQEAINAYTAAILACSDRAGEAKQRITSMVNGINKLKENAVAAEKKAAEARDGALMAEKKATEAQLNAETALANLEKANASTVALLLENADRDILNLRYEDALQKIKTAASLGALRPKVARAYLEIAFWHSETRNFKRSAALLDSLADFAKNTAVSALFQQLPPVYTVMPRNMLREAMKAVDSLHFDFLYTKKYYPDMVPVQGGKFIMGCDRIIDGDCQSDEILHEQELGSFHIARTETTVWQFAIYCAAEDMDIHDFIEKNWSDPGDNPIVNVEWYDAVEYANWVSKQKGGKEAISKNHAGLAGIYEVDIRSGYRLPTEAEWEYAAKGGNRPDKTLYSGSNTLDSVGWFSGNSERTQPVGEKKANALAIYDMSGNVEEWCWDWYGKYKTDPVKDYKGPPDEGSSRVVRGGSWNRNPGYFRSAADRDYYRPESRSDYLGFRLVFVP